MKTIHYSFNLRADGACRQKPIRLVIYLDGKQHKILTREKCLPVSWDSKKQCVKYTDRHCQYKKTNQYSLCKAYNGNCTIDIRGGYGDN